MSVIENIREAIRVPLLKSDFFSDKREVYDALISVSMPRMKPAELFELIERSHSRAWRERLGLTAPVTAQSVQRALPAAIVAFVHPGNTFAALAAVFSFVLVFAGAFDIIYAISARRENDAWWLQLVGGIIELALGLWAAGYWGRSAILLVAWVAAFALIRAR